MAYDKAADDGDVHELLHEEGIKPLIQNRTFKLEEPEKVLGGRTPLNVVYDEAGTVFCYDRVSEPPVRHPMAYIGHEAERGTLKYRCPARHQGWDCPSDAACNGERELRPDGARQAGDRPAAVPEHPARDQAVRAAVQGPHGGGAGQRPAEDLLGRRRRQGVRLAAVSRATSGR